MKVTIGQINTTNGDIEGNLAKIVTAIQKAKADGSDLLVLLEVAAHGYTSQDWFLDRDIIEAAAIQFVRKISGFNKPSAANLEAFDVAVCKVTNAGTKLFDSLITTAPPKNREIESEKA